MTDNSTDKEYGPLGPGHEPVKDPLKGLRGVLSGVLILEALTIFLSLTVILQIDNGTLWTTLNWGFIVALGAAHIVMAFLQRFKWAMKANLALQVIGLLGFLIHWSIGGIILIFLLVWWYVLHLRNNLVARMERGLLVTQHLDR